MNAFPARAFSRDEFFSLLRCVACRGALKLQGDSLRCPACGASYKITDGIPDLMPATLDEDVRLGISDWQNLRYDYDAELDKADRTCPERLQAIDDPLLEEAQGMVLDIGCGTARMAKPVEEKGGTYVGIDPSMKLLKPGAAKGAPALVCGVGERLPFPDACFDTILGGYWSFRYIKLDQAFPEIARVLKPGGTVAFSLLNYWSQCAGLIAWNIQNRKAPWTNLSNLCPTMIPCNDVTWFGRERKRLRRHGLRVLSVRSTRKFSLIQRFFKWKSYWPGSIGAVFGHDILVVCRKE
jgi:SAM-dependent methyltransferase